MTATKTKKKAEKRQSIHTLCSPQGVNLTGKTVKLWDGYFKSGHNPDEFLFKCSGGFGCDPRKMGRAIFGTFTDGEQARIERADVEGIVVTEPIVRPLGEILAEMLEYWDNGSPVQACSEIVAELREAMKRCTT